MKNVLFYYLLPIFFLMAGQVNAMPSPPPLSPITGTFTICPGDTTTLSNIDPGGVWTSTDLAVATIDPATGLITAVTAGTAVISYTIGADFATAVVTVNPLPVVAAISGTNQVCAGNTITLTNDTAGGAWSSSDVVVATVGGTTGVVSGLSAGTADISYTVTNGCGSTSVQSTITVNAIPAAISGTLEVCVASATTLSSSTIGGTWLSSTPAVATIGTSGIVSGVAAGTSDITYTVSGCITTAVVTASVFPVAGTISSAAVVCVASTTPLTFSGTGGSWSSSNTSIANVGSTGVLFGIVGGTANISYTVTNACGSAHVTTVATVEVFPTVGVSAGTSNVCVGNNVTLINPVSGGSWSTADVAIATIGSSSGIVSGIGGGTVEIYYTNTNSCGSAIDTMDFTVNALPVAIGGPVTVCRTFSVTLTNDSAGGTWSSTSTRVTVGGTTGIITGISNGTAIITYTLPSGCSVSTAFTVNPQPANIGGFISVCSGGTRVLTNAVSGGTWSSTNTAVASFSSPTVGIIAGLTGGTSQISYVMPTGCFATSVFTVNITPDAITGSTPICVLDTITLANTTPGGTWSSQIPSRASVGVTTGIVAGIASGTTLITYKMPGNCIATTVVTVSTSPSPITGITTVCAGSTTTLINTVPLGVWISGNTSVAVVVTPTGLVGGVAAGTATFTYALSNGCFRTTVLNVNPLPEVISGADNVCIGHTTTLATSSTGGSWNSIHSTVSVGSSSGIVTGVSYGTAAVSYSLPTGCRRTHVVSVNVSPAAVTGTLSVCEGLTTTLSSTPPMGSWTSSDVSIATVATGISGVVTGVAAGTAIMTYAYPFTGCNATAIVTVNALPDAISGAATVCAGAATTLASAAAGGSWSSGSTSIATADAATGIVTGVAAGTSLITYTLSTGCYDTAAIIVHPYTFAGTVSGASTVCETDTTTLTSSVAGGTWSMITGMVSVNAAGVVAGLSGGTDTVLYSFTDGCGTDITEFPITVSPLPAAGVITGNNNVCIGLTSLLSNSVIGGTWSNASTPVATVSASGVVTGIGVGTTAISYTTTNSCGSSTAITTVTVHPLVDPGTITGLATICMGDSFVVANPIFGGTWRSTQPWIASVNDTGKVKALFHGVTTIQYIVSNACSRDTATFDITVLTPAVCAASVKQMATADIKLYPNPTNGNIVFESPVSGNLVVYSIEGKEVEIYPVAAKTTSITLPINLAAGVYLCRFSGSDGSTAIVRLIYQQN
jgi:trimeric autotransporter adhesin